jgi:hypothetical protein
MAGDQPDITQIACFDHAASLLVQGVEAHIVANGGYFAGSLGEFDHFGGLLRRHRQRFLTHYIFPSGKDRLYLRIVGVIGRCDMHDIHGIIGEQFIQRRVGLVHAQFSGTVCAAIW